MKSSYLCIEKRKNDMNRRIKQVWLLAILSSFLLLGSGGSIAAARATATGKITAVLVVPGDMVVPDQVVAKLSE